MHTTALHIPVGEINKRLKQHTFNYIDLSINDLTQIVNSNGGGFVCLEFNSNVVEFTEAVS